MILGVFISFNYGSQCYLTVKIIDFSLVTFRSHGKNSFLKCLLGCFIGGMSIYRQEGLWCAPADKANARLRRKFYHMVLNNNKKHNLATAAVAIEALADEWFLYDYGGRTGIRLVHVCFYFSTVKV